MAKITCLAGVGAAIVGFSYMVAASTAVVDFVLLIGGLLAAAAGLFRLLRRDPPT